MILSKLILHFDFVNSNSATFPMECHQREGTIAMWMYCSTKKFSWDFLLCVSQLHLAILRGWFWATTRLLPSLLKWWSYAVWSTLISSITSWRQAVFICWLHCYYVLLFQCCLACSVYILPRDMTTCILSQQGSTCSSTRDLVSLSVRHRMGAMVQFCPVWPILKSEGTVNRYT